MSLHGDLRVWWIPQVPMTPFHVDVEDYEQGQFVLDLLANYDMFQFKNKVKPDYSNVGGIQVWIEDDDPEFEDGWVDVDSEESLKELLYPPKEEPKETGYMPPSFDDDARMP